MSNEHLSPDIYGINEYVNELKKRFITGVNEDTLMLGIFGYFGQMGSDMLQNSIVMASEFSNESIATKAKFEKNIIAHALGLNIPLETINAVPATMEVLLTFLEKDIIAWANAETANGDELPWQFIFDKDNKIYFGDYEFHTDYDIVIRKVEVKTQGTKKRFAYTAQYKQDDFDRGNPVSDTKNPYLNPPIRANVYGDNVIFVKTTIRQVEKATIAQKILSDNDISAKTITFKFDGNLAGFSLDVTEGSETYHMIPVYEGLNIDTGGRLYFWYTFLSSNTIRIKFDRNSRIPAVNADISINIQTTQGSKGNFTYDIDSGVFPHFNFESEKYNYANITCQIRPTINSAMYGSDKKTIEELKQIIPKEALSRGSITNTTDLENFFNMINTDYSKMYFFKKRDNCLERLYYSFIIMKNDINIIPTNTIDVKISPRDLQSEDGSDKLVLKQGTIFILPANGGEARLLKPGELLPEEDNSLYDGSFAYYLPYDYVISKSPLYGMFLMSTIHDIKTLDFSYINESCTYQYIATRINIDRNCLDNHNEYSIKINMLQNITSEQGDMSESPIRINDDGEVVADIQVFAIFYDDDGVPHRWAKADWIGHGEEEFCSLDYEFKFTTQDYIDNDNRIRIDTGLYDIGTNTESYAHFNSNMTTKIFILSKQGGHYGLGEPDLSTLIPGLEDRWSLSNTYSVIGGIDFFYDYSGIVKSIINATNDLIETEEDSTISLHEDDTVTVEHPVYVDGICTCCGKTKEECTCGTYVPPEKPEEPEPEPIVFEDLGVVLSYLSKSEIQLYDKYEEKFGPVITLPIDAVIMDFEQDLENKSIKLYFDKEKHNFIEVLVDDLTYVPPPRETNYHVIGVPVVKYGYFDNEDTAKQFFNELLIRKHYIDEAVKVLEDAFEMDFKFFNTYGPSRFFTWDNDLDVIDRVNVSLFFKLKLKPNYNSNIVEDIRKDIKEYVEDINKIESLHIPNLITYITNRYKDSIVYFEFVSINGMDAGHQHIYAMKMPDGIMVPEFVNINTLPGWLPDINIELA